MENLIARPDYLNQLISFKDKQLIKVVTGIRRCGKSTLFDLYTAYLKAQQVSDSQIIRLNLESPELYETDTALKLYNLVKGKLCLLK